jgi:hypothetical protein
VRRIDTIDGQLEVELDRDVVRSEFVSAPVLYTT